MKQIKPFLVILFLLFSIQFTLNSIVFPLSELWTDKPFLHVDSPFHIYQTYVAEAFGKLGKLQGYDPYFSSGYVAGVSKNHSAHFPAFFSALFSDTNPYIAYKIYYFLSACAAGLMIPIASYLIGSGTIATAISGFIAILLWWNSDLRGTHNSGMASSILSAYWGVAFGTALITSCNMRFSLISSIGLGLVGALGFMYYPFFPFLVALIVISGLIILWKEYNIPLKLYQYSIVAILSIVLNLFWIIPTFSDRQFGDVSTSFASTPNYWNLFVYIFGESSLINIAILFSIIYAAMFLRNAKLRQFSWVFLSAGLMAMLYGSFGAYLPAIAKLQSNRFLPLAFVVMSPVAGLGILQMLTDIRQYTGFRKLTGTVVFLGVLLISINCLRETWQEISYSDVPRRGLHPPEVAGEGPMTTWLLEWISNNTSDDSRILYEHTGHDVHDRAFISSYLAMKTKRQFANFNFPLLVPTGFVSGVLFNRNINDYSRDELQKLLWIYNIGLVITTEENTETAFNKLPNIKLVASRGDINIFRVENPPGFFMKGSGKLIQKDLNNLLFDDLKGEEVILRYNYFDCLKAFPSTVIEPVSIPLAPYPLIKLRNPPKTVTIGCF